jgi:hypothetical protein
MAHRRADVRAINDAIRTELQDRGELAQGEAAGALTFTTNDGQREFAPGDRIVFLENNRDLGVKNGMLGTVAAVEPDAIQVRLDGADRGQENTRIVNVPVNDYQAIDHGYATTIHKNQGATVDRAYVMASGSMDRHLTYVAMTRHRDGVQLYAAQDEFTNAGRLVEHGAAPFEHQAGNSQSYFVTLENDKGEQRTVWGVDLERAMTEGRPPGSAAPEIGEKIGLQHMGSTPVTLPDGTQTHRNTWKVQDAGELAYDQLERRLSRSGVKETTLDYVSDFAERRGIASDPGITEQMGVRSEIEVPAERAGQRPEREPAAGRHPAELDRIEDRPPKFSQKASADLAQDLGADLRADLAADRGAQKRPQQAEKQRGGMFAGLKLNARSAPSQERAAASPEQRPEREGSLRPASAPDRLAERVRGQSSLEVAVDRYARAYQSIDQHRRDGRPVLDMQKQEIQSAGQQLDQARPGSHDLIRSALQHDPQTAKAMTEQAGRERVGELVAGMERERAALSDPNVRAERFVNRWQELQGQRKELRGWRHDEARGKVESQMNGLAKSLERDPQAESLVRNRSRELGIRQEMRPEQSIARALQEEMTRSQRLSRGIGMGM